MKNRRMRKAFVVTAAVTAGFLLAACDGGQAEDTASSVSDSSDSGSTTEADGASGDASGDAGSGADADTGGGSDSGSDESSDEGAGDDSGARDKTGYGQSCGTNDLTWGISEKTQGGGYYLISVKAKSGITCALSADLPAIAFGSGGTEAGPAEQSAGDEITLSGSRTAYAGVNPKTTGTDGGTQYESIIVSVADEDPNPTELDAPGVVVDKPVVTNWHTDPQDAVPFTS
jgi:hypothetical protein